MEEKNKLESEEMKKLQAQKEQDLAGIQEYVAGVKDWEAENAQVFARVRAQIAENKRKDEEYFARARTQIRENEAMIRRLKAISAENDAIWEQFGLKVGQDNGQNPFLILEEVDPRVFGGMRDFAEKMKQNLLEEVRALGINYTPAKGGPSGNGKPKGNELSEVISSLVGNKGSSKGGHSARKKVARMGRL